MRLLQEDRRTFTSVCTLARPTTKNERARPAEASMIKCERVYVAERINEGSRARGAGRKRVSNGEDNDTFKACAHLRGWRSVLSV